MSKVFLFPLSQQVHYSEVRVLLPEQLGINSHETCLLVTLCLTPSYTAMYLFIVYLLM